MKCLLISLFFMMSAIPFGAVLCTIAVAPAYANEENIFPATTNQGQAADLVTQPVSITSGAKNDIYRTNNLRQVAGSISVVRDRGCKIKPLEIIKDPVSKLKQCLEQRQNQTPKPTTEPANYYKVPALESGIRVNVTQF